MQSAALCMSEGAGLAQHSFMCELSSENACTFRPDPDNSMFHHPKHAIHFVLTLQTLSELTSSVLRLQLACQQISLAFA